MPVLLFVCTGNQSRSPIAAASFRRELAIRKIDKSWQVLSAGTWTSNGLPAEPGAVAAAKRLGLDVSNHRSISVTNQLIKEADLILVMERGQKEALENEFKESADKVHLLSEVTTGIPFDISDPVLSPSARDIHVEIDELIRNGFDRILAMEAGADHP